MGCNTTNDAKVPEALPSKRVITVATLNYCGVMNSPFEFYCEEYQNELKQISRIFQSLIPRYVPTFAKDKFKWEMGKIDLKLRVGRYSPMFRAEVGIENGKFLSRTDFQKKWDEVFEVERKKINLECQNSEKQVTRLYDFMAFHTMLRYVYKIDAFEEAINRDPEIYLKTLRPFYQLSFLNEERKVKKMVDNFSKLEADVFFFQEYSEYFYNYLVSRREHIISVDETKDTMIIAKESSFDRQKNTSLILGKLSQEQRKNLNWAERSAFLILGNYIFICAHLSSKAEKNRPQIELVKKGLSDLRNTLPEYDIILGGDLNSYLGSFSKEFYIYPESESQLTTIKKRTMTQGQFNKAEKVVEESKDKIISTLKIESANIMYINGRVPSKDNLVPTNEHPFDHFVLVAKIQKRP